LPRPSRIGKREAPTAKWRLAIVEGELEGQLFHMEHETNSVSVLIGESVSTRPTVEELFQ